MLNTLYIAIKLGVIFIYTDFINTFNKDGHVRINKLMDQQEIKKLRTAVKETVEWAAQNKHSDYEADSMVIKTLNIWQKSETARQIIFSKEWANIAAKLLGVPAVRLYHDAALFKMPGATPTGWHQDNSYMIFNRTITLWLPLVDIPQEIGSLSFVSGTHMQRDLEAEQMRLLTKCHRLGLTSIVNYGPMKAGDATFHSGWTVHSAASNTTDITREVLVIIYYPDREQVLDSSNSVKRQENANRWFPNGMKDMNGPLHPLLTS